ncbi:hypothetical protein KS4_30220 [Poriferisphaera corsica]|uniref:EF-hand domain-containing protein n=1 Tax=Poriferisphaera corsica TaxID=2528020 RepID=A0A517YXJ5_9BACT|nr:hypothetical protein [Poriferisphaera corsica]QDU34945.1 hypothetical protein KS4_30220 [Poriferisphaera corsica]
MSTNESIIRVNQSSPRQRGAAIVLAMMFLVIFGSLSAAMAILSQGNLATADSHLKINRSLAAAETGVNFMLYRIKHAAETVRTSDGLINESNAPSLWLKIRDQLISDITDDFHYTSDSWYNAPPDGEGTSSPTSVFFDEIATAPGSPTFQASLQQHPISGESYSSSYYQRPPYRDMDIPVSATNPLDSTWIRLTVKAHDGPAGPNRVTRTIKMDLKLGKKIRYAILSRSRVMVGRNVMIDGPVGSNFNETNLEHGHPIQMLSDFRGLSSGLDAKLDALVGSLIGNSQYHDTDGDNRININNPTELGTLHKNLDVNNDGFIDEFDLFLDHYGSIDTDTNLITVSSSDLRTAGVNDTDAEQLLELIDTFGSSKRPGYNDGVIDALDRYTKIRGEIYITASRNDWNNGAADFDNSGTKYQDYFQGSITPDFRQSPLTFNASQNSSYNFKASDFDVTTFRNKATGDLQFQMLAQASSNPSNDPNKPLYNSDGAVEEVPYGAAHPYDYYERPVYKNMTFTNTRIPKGTNALFVNCTFIGVTFVESAVDNIDPNYNYAGMQESNKDYKHPDKSVTVDGNEVPSDLGSKTTSNNLRFEDCTFEGAIVTDSPKEYTHTRNKIAFTGQTQFKIQDSAHLSDDEKQLYERSAILAPNYSIEMGTFVAPSDSNETVNLTGTIVAGLIDMRGQVKVRGSILTTFEPKSNTGPVLGNTSPQFNTTIGYFSSDDGDLEAEVPPNGVGVIQVTYDPTIPLPDGINGPIELQPYMATYTEAGATTW